MDKSNESQAEKAIFSPKSSITEITRATPAVSQLIPGIVADIWRGYQETPCNTLLRKRPVAHYQETPCNIFIKENKKQETGRSSRSIEVYSKKPRYWAGLNMVEGIMALENAICYHPL